LLHAESFFSLFNHPYQSDGGADGLGGPVTTPSLCHHEQTGGTLYRATDGIVLQPDHDEDGPGGPIAIQHVGMGRRQDRRWRLPDR
jgi:hypothetical protein